MGNAVSTRNRSDLEPPVPQRLGDAIVVKHQGLRLYQEDEFEFQTFTLAEKKIDFFSVLDGHGGGSTSKHCKKRLLVNLSNSVRFDPACLEASDDTTLQNYMKDAFVLTERELLSQNADSPCSFPDNTEEAEGSIRIYEAIESPQAATLSGKTSIPLYPVTFSASSPRSESSLSALAKPFTSSLLSDTEPLSASSSSLASSASSDCDSTSAKPPPLNLKSILAISSPPRVWTFDDGSGSCALVCMKTPEFISLANAGDCRALLIRKDKSFEVLIDEHKATIEEEISRVKAAGLYVSGDRVIGELMVTRSIGDFKYKGIPREEVLQAVSCVPSTKILRIDDSFAYLMLMSDGIVDGISMEELSTMMMQEKALEAKILEIIEHCLSENHSFDNMTLIGIPF